MGFRITWKHQTSAIFPNPPLLPGLLPSGVSTSTDEGGAGKGVMVGGSGKIGIPGNSSRDLLIPLVEGHQLKGSFNHPKKVTS